MVPCKIFICFSEQVESFENWTHDQPALISPYCHSAPWISVSVHLAGLRSRPCATQQIVEGLLSQLPSGSESAAFCIVLVNHAQTIKQEGMTVS